MGGDISRRVVLALHDFHLALLFHECVLLLGDLELLFVVFDGVQYLVDQLQHLLRVHFFVVVDEHLLEVMVDAPQRCEVIALLGADILDHVLSLHKVVPTGQEHAQLCLVVQGQHFQHLRFLYQFADYVLLRYDGDGPLLNFGYADWHL